VHRRRPWAQQNRSRTVHSHSQRTEQGFGPAPEEILAVPGISQQEPIDELQNVVRLPDEIQEQHVADLPTENANGEPLNAAEEDNDNGSDNEVEEDADHTEDNDPAFVSFFRP
jgi:hypothetical protein